MAKKGENNKGLELDEPDDLYDGMDEPMPEGMPGDDEGKMEQPEEEAQRMAEEEQKKKKKKIWKPPTYTISDAFRLFCRRTNGHGWMRIVRARSMKGTVFWFLMSVLLFAVGVVYTATLWSRFIRYDTETSLSSTVGKQMFPSVTICSNNPIKASKIRLAEPQSYRDMLQKIPSNVERLLNESIYYTHKLKAEALDPRYEAHKDIVAASEGTTEDQRRALGYKPEELVAYCAYGGVICDFTDNATTRFFYDMDYGNCYTWAPPESEKEIYAGRDNGLHLVFKVDTKEYLPFYTESEGIKVDIHQRDTMPLPNGFGMSAPAGFETEFAMTVKRFDRLPEPYNDPGCVTDYDDFKKFYLYDYSLRACMHTCMQQVYRKRCECADFREPVAKDVPFCNTRDRNTIACMEAARFAYKNNPQEFCKCPPKCTEIQYTTVPSMSRWPSPEFSDNFLKAFKFSPDNTASLRVYFSSPVTVIHTDIPRESAVQFLGWLGGQLSVWTGASLITVLEFVMFCLTSALVLFTENMDWLLEDNNKYMY